LKDLDKEVVNVTDLEDDILRVIEESGATQLEKISSLSAVMHDFFCEHANLRNETNDLKIKKTLSTIYDLWKFGIPKE